jgi:UDP-N-acetyl-D-mannosaminuronate dehydrogenase
MPLQSGSRYVLALRVHSDHSISVIGLGRVGLPLALSFASAGARVLGIDHDPELLASTGGGLSGAR